MKHPCLPLLCMLALAGCAATPMQQDVWDGTIAAQAARVGLESRCCSDYSALPTVPLSTAPVEFTLDASAAIVRVNGAAAPAVRIALPAQVENRRIQFFSFSDRKRAALQLGSLMFLRPTLVFLDASGSQLSMLPDLTLCWGDTQGVGGVWARADIPTGAASVIVAAGISKPTQLIDTRKPGGVESLGAVGGAAAESIADARQSYINEIRVGYEGLAHVELVAGDSRPSGRCVADR